MRYLKFLLVTFFFSILVFNSCQDENFINLNNNGLSAQESISLQTIINQISDQIGDQPVSNINPESLCFQFVFPIQLTYNNGNNITINGFNGLVEVLENQNSEHYITGIIMPFQVIKDNVTLTIASEAELIALLESCDYTTVNENVVNTFCFDIVFPIYVTSENGQNVAIDDVQAFLAFLNTQTNGYQAEIVFPITVMYQGATLSIANLYAFNELIDSCTDPNEGCACPEYYSPVCIDTGNGIVEFGNMCFAECEGYTQDDVVSCNNGFDCEVFNLEVTVGDCNDDDTYALTIDFNYNNADNALFDVYARDNVHVGTYALAQLPITIQNFPDSELSHDFIKISINDTPDCYTVLEWESPNCGGNDGCVCPAIYAPVCVQGPNGIITFENACHAECEGYSQADFINCNNGADFNFGSLLGSCFTIAYPVQVMHEGAVYTMDSNNELLQYYFPNVALIPNFVYPVTVTFSNTPTGSQTFTFNTQTAFINHINEFCE